MFQSCFFFILVTPHFIASFHCFLQFSTDKDFSVSLVSFSTPSFTMPSRSRQSRSLFAKVIQYTTKRVRRANRKTWRKMEKQFREQQKKGFEGTIRRESYFAIGRTPLIGQTAGRLQDCTIVNWRGRQINFVLIKFIYYLFIIYLFIYLLFI